jgi:hypothetical protein
MSHHLDTPLAAQTGQLLIDDLYVFPGEDSTVFVMDVNSNVNGLHSEPGFHPEARYEFRVHFDGAAFETLTYRASFGEADAAGRQSLLLDVLTGDEARGDGAAGDLVLEGRTGETASPTRPSSQSSWRSPTRTPCSGRVPAPAYGARPSSPPTPAAGGRSTARDTP